MSNLLDKLQSAYKVSEGTDIEFFDLEKEKADPKYNRQFQSGMTDEEYVVDEPENNVQQEQEEIIIQGVEIPSEDIELKSDLDDFFGGEQEINNKDSNEPLDEQEQHLKHEESVDKQMWDNTEYVEPAIEQEELVIITQTQEKQLENENKIVYNNLDIELIRKVIGIHTTYMNYEENIQKTIKMFLDIDSDSDKSFEVVFEVLNLNQNKKQGLDDLVTFKQEDRVTRAFSLMSIPDERLMNLHQLVVMFNEDVSIEVDLKDRLKFCRELEMGIDMLNDESLYYLVPMNELFNV